LPDTPLAKKLGIKSSYRLLVLHAPEGYTSMLNPLPEGVTIDTQPQPQTTYDLVQIFFLNRAAVDQHAPDALAAVKPGGLLWLCYPKKTSGAKTDIHRDTGWQTIQDAGWEGVSLISIDDTWSAMRFRPSADVKSRGKSVGRS
jgi:hypothetical protein